MITRKLILCLTILWLFYGVGFISAQSNPEKDIELQYLDAFSTLDMSEVNTGILYNKVPEYVPLFALDGRILPDTVAMDGKSFAFAYGMINRAHLDNSALPPNDTFINRVMRWQNTDEIVLGALYFRYDKFRDDIIERGLITEDSVNKRFYRGDNRSESPFAQDTLFSFTCMKNNSHTLSQIFRLATDAFFSNMPLGFRNAEIDFDDGRGYIPIALGGEIRIDYREYGKYYIRLRMQDDAGRYLYAHSYLQIAREESSISPRNYGDAVLLHTNTNIEVWGFINNNCGNDKIRKPLILIDGFDLTNTWGANRVRALLNEAGLANILNPEDYDIFYLNNINSTIDIFENGGYVREAIEWINAQKAIAGSDEKNVVIGFSMGGLVGKVALRSMELDGVDHQTELYFTYDSPMKGANIPMGLQCMLNHIANYNLLGIPLYQWSSDLGVLVDGLNSPAAQQMLYYHESNANWIDDNILFDSKYTEASALESTHDEFYQEFEALGQLEIPQLAISNGAIIDGDKVTTGQGFLPGDVLLLQHLDLDDLVGDNFWGVLGVILLIEGGWGTNFNADLSVAALPEGNGTIYDGYIRITILHLGFGDRDIRKIRNAKPYDSCPGGSRQLNFEGVPLNWKATAHCFIPTISSLALDDINNKKYPYYNANYEIKSNVLPYTFYKNYAGSNTIKNTYFEFPSFSNINEQHIFMSPATIGFLSNYLVAKNPLYLYLLGIGTNVLQDRIYNYGTPLFPEGVFPLKMDNIIDFNLEVRNSGKLWINRNDFLAFTDIISSPFNTNPTDYKVIIKGYACQYPVLVKIDNGGEFRIGDQSVSNTAILEIKELGELEIGSGGIAKIEDMSKIEIKDLGKLRISSNGLLNATLNSEIVIKSGGVLHVQSGGILRVSHYSDVIVENGGKLIIDDGAIIQTWSSGDPIDGVSRILIKTGGELVWNGNIDYTGNGYFEFEQGHILTLNADFRFWGEGKNIRMIQLDQNAILNINNKKLSLFNGKIVYKGNSRIITSNNAVSAIDVNFISESTNDIALITKNTGSTYLSNCIVTGFDNYGIDIQGSSNTLDFNDIVTDCYFDNEGNSLIYSDRQSVNINNSTFRGGTAISGFDCVTITSENNDIRGWKGLYLNSVLNFLMIGGSIDFEQTGIYARDGYNNIKLISGAQLISDNWIDNGSPPSSVEWDDFGAVVINGAIYGIPPHHQVFGKVYMECSKIESYVGILGTNITLQIDGINNGGTNPNVFSCKYAFAICYYENLFNQFGFTTGPIYARGNYWRTNPVATSYPHPYGENIYSFHDIGWNEVCGSPLYNDHELIYLPKISDYPEFCFPRDPQGLVLQESDVIPQYPISFYPNPSSGVLKVNVGNTGLYNLKIFNSFGQKIMEKEVSNNAEIDLTNNGSGLYIYEISGKNEIDTGKLIIIED